MGVGEGEIIGAWPYKQVSRGVVWVRVRGWGPDPISWSGHGVVVDVG